MDIPEQQYLFYFANSWSGGGAVRLGHYVKAIHRPNYRFIVNSQMSHGFKSDDERLQYVKPTAIERLLNENLIINRFDLTHTTVFSHGAPLAPKTQHFVLHLNNALPLVWNEVTLSPSLRAKMAVLNKRLKNSAKKARIITVESLATLKLVEERWGEDFSKKCRILTNGVDALNFDFKGSDNEYFALTIGTYPYKRLDLVEKVLREFVGKEIKLKIIGATDRFVSKDREQFTNLPYLETRKLVATCEYYITMSQIENCSISLLEAIYHKRKILCSSIPSHVEFLQKHGYEYEMILPGILHALPPRMLSVPVPGWGDIVDSTYQILEDASLRRR